MYGGVQIIALYTLLFLVIQVFPIRVYKTILGGATDGSGQDGQDGAQGIQGEMGDPGIPGQDGNDGTDGADGAMGLPGQNGVDGADGVDGAQGVQGEQGIQGDQGLQGVSGQAGTDGTDGAQGIQGEQGSQGPAGEDGQDGVGTGTGEDNVQSDWNESDTTDDAFILNKPVIPTSDTPSNFSRTSIASLILLLLLEVSQLLLCQRQLKVVILLNLCLRTQDLLLMVTLP